MLRPTFPLSASWTRRTRADSWDGDEWADPVTVRCAKGLIATNASPEIGSAGSVVGRRDDALFVEPQPENVQPDVGDYVDGEIVEAARDVLALNGELVARVLYTEPRGI